MKKSLVSLLVIGLALSACESKKDKEVDVSIKKLSPVQSMVVSEANKQGVNKCLALAVSKIESNHRCDAVGAAGELGPLQIKYQSARGFGYKGSRSQLSKSCALKIKWGMDHLKRAFKTGGSNWKAAYLHNSGIYAKSFKQRGPTNYANKVMAKYKTCGK